MDELATIGGRSGWVHPIGSGFRWALGFLGAFVVKSFVIVAMAKPRAYSELVSVRLFARMGVSILVAAVCTPGCKSECQLAAEEFCLVEQTDPCPTPSVSPTTSTQKPSAEEFLGLRADAEHQKCLKNKNTIAAENLRRCVAWRRYACAIKARD